MIRLDANPTGATDYPCAVCGVMGRGLAVVSEPWPHHIDLCPEHLTVQHVAALEGIPVPAVVEV